MPEYPQGGGGGSTTNAKNSVKAASTANVVVSAFVGTTMDGVTLSANDRILLKNQNTASQNGIWLYEGALGALVRPSDFATASNQAGATVAVQSGTANSGSFWELTGASVVVDTDAETWVESAVTFDSTAPTTSAVGDAAAAGSATTAAHRDHLHGRESFGNVTAQTTTNAASANGSATTPSRSDHSHGTPADFVTGFFGDGVDSAMTFDGSATVTGAGSLSLVPSSNVYTLTRDIFPTTLIVTSPAVIKIAGFRIHASTSISGTGTIQDVGADASGATGGAARSNAIFYAGAAGATGVVTNAAAASGTNALSTQAYGGGGGSGGGSGTGNPAQAAAGGNADGWLTKSRSAVGAAGTGGSTGGQGGNTGPSSANGSLRTIPALTTGMITALGGVTALGPGGGGGAGAGDGTNAGGGGGAGGGVVLLCSPTINITGTVSVKGGNGANGVGTNAGGGGGGGGGVIVAVGRSVAISTTNVAGGTHGTHAGAAGDGGDGGTGLTFLKTFT